jgi:RNA polymerase sigma-70 factor (ECF subfamily)
VGTVTTKRFGNSYTAPPGMTRSPAPDVTGLLRAWSGGDEEALPKLLPVVYAELHRAARRQMAGERASHTLQATALIHEVYLRLVDVPHVDIQDRAHFLALCARLMRRILIDFARSRRYRKRGAGAPHVELTEALVVSARPDPDLVALDEAMQALAAVDARKSQVVELRFFGGLTVEETASALSVSPETVMRDWKMARAWLLRELDRSPRHGS